MKEIMMGCTRNFYAENKTYMQKFHRKTTLKMTTLKAEKEMGGKC
jgi:hypothetical protein